MPAPAYCPTYCRRTGRRPVRHTVRRVVESGQDSREAPRSIVPIGQAGGRRTGRRRHRPPQAGLPDHLRQRPAEGGCIARRHQQARACGHGLGYGTGSGAHHRQAGGKRLRQHHAVSLVVGRQYEYIGFFIRPGDRQLVALPGQHDLRIQPEFDDSRADRRRAGRIARRTADADQLPTHGRIAQAAGSQRFHQQQMPLAGRQRRYAQQPDRCAARCCGGGGGGSTTTSTSTGGGGRRVGGRPGSMRPLGSRQHHRDTVGRNAVIPQRHGGGRAGHHDSAGAGERVALGCGQAGSDRRIEPGLQGQRMMDQGHQLQSGGMPAGDPGHCPEGQSIDDHLAAVCQTRQQPVSLGKRRRVGKRERVGQPVDPGGQPPALQRRQELAGVAISAGPGGQVAGMDEIEIGQAAAQSSAAS